MSISRGDHSAIFSDGAFFFFFAGVGGVTYFVASEKIPLHSFLYMRKLDDARESLFKF